MIRVGTAGWSLPRAHAQHFPASGSHLERYAQVLAGVEINSSFYRPHRPSTYARWAASTPGCFRFSVKAPRAITHECALAPGPEQFKIFLEEVSHLSSRLGPILFQLPPRQAFSAPQARAFFMLFRDLYPDGQAVLEPRHPGWYDEDAEQLLREFQIARAVADPPPAPQATRPGGDTSLVYHRLHGSPRIYYSSYPAAWLDNRAATLSASTLAMEQATSETWCIFDNTASGAAADNAVQLSQLLSRPPK